MLELVTTTRFRKDVKRSKKQGLNTAELLAVVNMLLRQETPPELKDHALIGEYKGYRDCHIRPDWILIYRVAGNDLILERTGSHSELFQN